MTGQKTTWVPRRRMDRDIERAGDGFLGGVPFAGGIASWRRSRDERSSPQRNAPPLNPDGLRRVRARHQELIAAATPVLRETAALIAEMGGIVLLCGPDGLVLESTGAARTLDMALDANTARGGASSQQICRSHAVVTALQEGRPVEVHGSEHYCQGFQRWAHAAAPVRDPRNGRLLGALDIAYDCVLPARPALPLAVSVARRIENALELRDLRRHRFLLEHYADRLARSPNDAVLLLDNDGALLAWNAAATSLLVARGLGLTLVRGQAFDPYLARLGAGAHESLSLEGDHAGMVVVAGGQGSAPPVVSQPDAERAAVARSASGPVAPPARLRDTERDAILAALRAENGQRQRAAARLGISRTTLYRRLLAYGIAPAPVR